MKFSTTLLAVSLAANAALSAAFFLRAPAAPAATSSTLSAQPSALSSSTPSLNAHPSTLNPSPPPWANLTTGDLPALVARLRAAGFPPAVIHALVLQRFELRREELTHDDLDVPFWKSSANTKADPKTTAALEALDRERTETLKQLFGTEMNDGTDETQVMRARLYGNIPDAKLPALLDVQRKFGEQMSEIYRSANGAVPTAASEKIQDLQRQQHAALAGILTPDELHEFDLRNSPTAATMKFQLGGMNLSEAEYRSIYAVREAFDAQFPASFGSLSPEAATARTAAEQAMTAQIQNLLPPDRYADYLQSSRPGAQQLNQLVTRLDLPLKAAAQVSSIQQDIQSRAAALQRAPNLTPAERTAQLAALSDEASAKISLAIGPRGLEGYKQAGGNWLNNLAPAPRANPKR